MTYYPNPSSPANDANAQLPPWRRGRPGADDRQTSLLFWLTMLALGCVSLVGMTWAASNVLAQKGSEKLLRVDLLLPKLKSIHWERKAVAFHLLGPAPRAKASPTDRNPMSPHAPPPPFGAASMLVHETPLLPILDTCDEPVVYLNPCNLQRGDSPMTRNWKTLTMYSLLTAAAATLAPPPMLLAQEDNKAALEKLSKDVQALTKRIEALDEAAIGRAMGKELEKLEKGKLTELGTGIKDLGTRVDGVKSDLSKLQGEQLAHKLNFDNQKIQVDYLLAQVKNLNSKLIAGNNSSASPASPAVDKTFMEDLRSYMKKLDDTLAKLGPTDKRLSMSPALGSAPPSYGRLVFHNLYTDELLFIVNGAKYRVPAQTRFVLENVPAGTLRYEIAADRWGPLENLSINLTAGETFTLRALNRP